MKRRRRRKKKQMMIIKWFKSLGTPQKVLFISTLVVLLLFLVMTIYIVFIYNKLNVEDIPDDQIVINDLDDDTGEGYTNFALFGGDSRTGDVTRDLNTDCIIVASLNNKTKEVKLVSVYRDTLLDLSKGTIKKCNAAYSNGGATMAINMLNMNLDLDIQKYVTVEFGAVADLVDSLGGIEIDVGDKERDAVNHYLPETATVTGKPAVYLTKSGVQTLDGVQAVTYARIRKGVGDDYARTERQRLIIKKIAEKALKSDLITINKIINELFPRIATNLTLTEVLSYAKSFTKYKITETTGFPFEKGSGTIPGKGDCVFPITLKKNVTMLHQFLYGTENYTPSAKVGSISDEIAVIIGNRKPDTTPSTGIGGGTGTSADPGTGTEPGGEDGNTGTGGDNTGQGNENGNQGDTGTGGENGNTGTGGDNTGQGNGNGNQGDTGNGNEGNGTGGNSGNGDSGNGNGNEGNGTGGNSMDD